MKKIAVMGVGKSGFEAIKFLNKKGYELFVNDRNKSISKEILDYLNNNNISYEFGNNSAKILDCDTIVLSPGIPRTVDVLQRALKNKIRIINDIELFYQYKKNGKIVAVTGSNGKTTITSLCGYVLKNFTDTFIGGNIGVAALEAMKRDYNIYVLELSSFQLESIDQFRPDVAVVSNITPDHLDRYNGFDHYADTKMNIAKNMQNNDVFILNGDDFAVLDRKNNNFAKKLFFSRKKEDDIYYLDGKIHVNDLAFDCNELFIKGNHNIENVMAVLGIIKALNYDLNRAFDIIKTFKGVEHRMEFVDNINGVDFYNDSKATNVDSVIAALNSFSNNVIWLAGGIDKHSPLKDLVSPAEKCVKKAIFFGQDRKKFIDIFDGFMDYENIEKMEDAIKFAKKIAKKGDTVLLSPACASFDEFKNFENRGNSFKEWIYGK